jgi:predicted RNA-binding protein (virulence factor B family)
MKTGEIMEAHMLRIEPDAVVLLHPSAGELRMKPDLKQPFVAGRKILVFVSHKDQEGRWWCSTNMPPLALGEVEFLPVHSVSRAGVFFDWGQERPLFCPFHLVVGTLRPGMMAAVRLIADERSDRLMASMQWKKELMPAGEEYHRGREVEILVMEPHDLGFLVLVDKWFQGIIYSNQIFRPVRSGEKMKAWVNLLRPDGKLDILLRKPGYGEVQDVSEVLLSKIREAGGRMPLGDKSPADEIYRQLGMSKKVFKQVSGSLFKQGKVFIGDYSVTLQNDDGD